MSTLVCFHAHPDDEALSTGGLMAKAAAMGHRVVLVTATGGEHGEPQPGVLSEGEELWERRLMELAESASVLGAEEPRLLGYEDSGMDGEPTNQNPNSFWQADLDQAAKKLAAILTEVEADVLTIYDDHGLYGHPDHIQVHRVGLAAAQLVGLKHVYEATVNRDQARLGFEEINQYFEQELAEGDQSGDDRPQAADMDGFGLPEAELAYSVDVSQQLATKRASMAVHRSQIAEGSFFLALPDEIFGRIFAREWYAIPVPLRNDPLHAPSCDQGGPVEVELLPGLGPSPARV